MVPGSLHQQPASVPVAGLGDRLLRPGLPRGVLGGYQPDERADRAAGEPVPVADLDGQRERGQGADPGQAPSRCAIGVNSESPAICSMSTSSRSPRARVVKSAS